MKTNQLSIPLNPNYINSNTLIADGVIEKSYDAEKTIEELCQKKKETIICSYNIFIKNQNIEERRKKGYFNDFSFNDIITSFSNRNYILVDFFQNRANNQSQYVFIFKNKTPSILTKYSLCTGCGACANICPNNAIEMHHDEYGFIKPVSNTNCVNCGKCINCCPTIQFGKINNTMNVRKTYACMGDDLLRGKSSSGGAFSILAKQVLSENGVVFGATWDNDFSVKHIYIENEEQLSLLQKSKYIQSNTGNTFKRVKEFLKLQRFVLYVGTPCQIAGLKMFLGDDFQNENLVTIDLLCNHVPSQKIFKKYIQDNYNKNTIKSFTFRDKTKGETCDLIKIEYINGEAIYTNITNDAFSQGFEAHLFCNDTCEHCFYRTINRIGDISLGDFWGIEWFDKSMRDGKGTSAVLINSLKGEQLFNKIQNKFSKVIEAPLSIIKTTQFEAERKKHPNTELFHKLLKTETFNKAIELSLNPHYDILLLSIYSNKNYGGAITYFALYSKLIELGYSVALADRPKESIWKPAENIGVFRENPYPEYVLLPQTNYKEEMRKYAEMCDTVLVGSDQFFYFPLLHSCSDIFLLDWVSSNKKKIAYAASWGRTEINGQENEKQWLSVFLNQFNAISIREKGTIPAIKKQFGLDLDFVLDPVFLCDNDIYLKLAEKSIKKIDEPYIFSYMVDPDENKADLLKNISNKTNIKTIAVAGVEFSDEEINKLWSLTTESDTSLEDWIKFIINSEYVITDSFHGICLCIIFKKQFVALCNEYRGAERFNSILNELDLSEYLINKKNYDYEKIYALLHNVIDYNLVYEKLEKLRDFSLSWLENNLKKENRNKFSYQDYLKIEIEKNTKFRKENEVVIKESQQHILGLEQYTKSNDELIQSLLLRAQGLEQYTKSNDELIQSLLLRAEGLEQYTKSNDELIQSLLSRAQGLEQYTKSNDELIQSLLLRAQGLEQYTKSNDELIQSLLSRTQGLEQYAKTNDELIQLMFSKIQNLENDAKSKNESIQLLLHNSQQFEIFVENYEKKRFRYKKAKAIKKIKEKFSFRAKK